MVKILPVDGAFGRFFNNQLLLSSGLKLHKIKMIRMKNGFMLRKEKMLT
jgi:hypothetical protein